MGGVWIWPRAFFYAAPARLELPCLRPGGLFVVAKLCTRPHASRLWLTQWGLLSSRVSAAHFWPLERVEPHCVCVCVCVCVCAAPSWRFLGTVSAVQGSPRHSIHAHTTLGKCKQQGGVITGAKCVCASSACAKPHRKTGGGTTRFETSNRRRA